jgi:lipoprotein-anchoring transpeptidase ErfK/SrfK
MSPSAEKVSSQAAAALLEVPRPIPSAFQVPTPRRLGGLTDAARWAPVLTPTLARAAPSTSARVVARLAPLTPERTTNLVLVVGRAHREGRNVWLRARLPVLPNGTIAWVSREALGSYTFVQTRLIIDLRRLTATLYRKRKAILRVPVGIGTSEFPTPTGHFYIRNRLAGFNDPFYGPIAFGTSARSPTLTDWPADGFVGIHGTNRPDLVPGRVSHGCIRMRNPDIRRLAVLMPVGTPVTIR